MITSLTKVDENEIASEIKNLNTETSHTFPATLLVENWDICTNYIGNIFNTSMAHITPTYNNCLQWLLSPAFSTFVS